MQIIIIRHCDFYIHISEWNLVCSIDFFPKQKLYWNYLYEKVISEIKIN